MIALLLAILIQLQLPADPYWYSAILQGCYDGDTCTVDIDLGLGLTVKNRVLRLYGINAPEMKGEEKSQGIVTRDWLLDRARVGEQVMLHTHRDESGKYGRLLAELWYPCGDGWRNANREMIEQGLAVEY